MSKPDKKQLATYYRDTFGFDPDALSAEQKSDLRAGIAKIKSDRQAKIPASAARALSLWQHFEAGEHPGLVDVERARKAGVPQDQIDRINAERSAVFQARATSAHAARTVPDPELKALPDLQLPPANVDPATGLQYDKVYPSPDGSLPPGPSAELKSLPDLQLPPENIDPKTGLDFTKVYPGPGGQLPPGPASQEDEMDFTRGGGT